MLKIFFEGLSRVFLSLTEVFQNETRIFYGIYVMLFGQPRCTRKTFTLCSNQDGCDDAYYSVPYFFISFLSLEIPFENVTRRKPR